jgi:hypothetical protein
LTSLNKFGLSEATYGSLKNALNIRRSAEKKKRLAIIIYASALLGIGPAVILAITFVGNQPSAAALDAQKPEINISSPSNNVTINGPHSGVAITVVGEAMDPGSGIQKVEVRFIGAASKTPYQMANPSSPQNWSAWSFERALPAPGIYDIRAKATDNAGNEQWSTIKVRVSPAT